MSMLGLLKGLGIGAGAMYLFDPDLGQRRRSVLFDKLTSIAHEVSDLADVELRDLNNRIEGLWAESQAMWRAETDVPPARLEARIRSRLGRWASHPRAIEVRATGNRVVLSGLALRDEVDRVVAAVRCIRGVQHVENRLEPHDPEEHVPALQGGRPHVRHVARSQWTPAARLVAGLTGTVLMARCAGRPTLTNMLLGTFGWGLAIRAISNLSLDENLHRAQVLVAGQKNEGSEPHEAATASATEGR